MKLQCLSVKATSVPNIKTLCGIASSSLERILFLLSTNSELLNENFAHALEMSNLGVCLKVNLQFPLYGERFGR